MRSLALLLLLLTLSAPAETPFCSRIRSLLADPAVASAHWGISVTTLTGTPLCSINETQLFRPASNAKLFITLAALTLLDPAQPGPATTLSPPLQPGEATRNGDLTIAGRGDGFLSERPMPYAPLLPGSPTPAPRRNPLETLADSVAASGLKHIHGDIIGDDTLWPSEPYGPDWSIDDTLWGYGAPVSALSINDNKTALTLTPGPDIGAPATAALAPLPSFYKLQSDVTTTAPKTPAAIGIERAPGSRTVRIFGSIPLGAPYLEDLAIDDPAEYAALLFKSMLEARGVTIDGAARARHRLSTITNSFTTQSTQPLPTLPNSPAILAAIPAALPAAQTAPLPTPGPTLLEDIALTLKVSQNLHAELLLHRLGRQFAQDGSAAEGARVVRQFALGVGVNKDDFVLFDGSGLSGHDLATPRAFTQLLTFAAAQPWFPSFKAALPISGTDGSLLTRFPPSFKGRVFAKTGTLSEARALSGYVTAGSGNTVIFSILVDNHLPSSHADRTLTDRIVDLIATEN